MEPFKLSSPAREEISETTPLRLKDAVRIEFPHGGMTVSGLRREIKKGNLAFEMIAGKQWTTRRYIRQMRERCLVEPKARASIFASAGDVTPYGSSSTDKTKSALVAAQMIAEGLKKPSPATSPESISQTGKVVTLRK
jgi:hypothetical protein